MNPSSRKKDIDNMPVNYCNTLSYKNDKTREFYTSIQQTVIANIQRVRSLPKSNQREGSAPKTHHEVKKESSQPTIIEVMQESSQSQNNEVKYESQPAANQVKQEFVEPANNQEKIEMPPLPRIPLFIGEFPVSENIKRVEPDKEKGQQKAGSREPSQVRSKDSKQRESENKSIRIKKHAKKSEDGSIESNQQNIGQQQSIKSKKERSSESKNKRMGQTAESSTDQIIKEAIKHDKLQLVEIKSDKKLQKRGIKSNRGSHQGSQNQVNDKIEAPSDESGSVNSQKKDKILLRAQQAYVNAKKDFQKEYQAMKTQKEKDSSESKAKLFLVKMLHLRSCKSFMSFKALEAQVYKQDIQKTKRELAIDRYKECRQNAQGLYKSYKTAQQMYFKVAGSGTQEEKARKEMFESAKQMFLQQKETVQKLQYRMKQSEPSQGEIESIKKLFDYEKEIQRIEEDFKQFDQLFEEKELKWIQRAEQIACSSDPDLEEIKVHLKGKREEFIHSRQARKKAFDSIRVTK